MTKTILPVAVICLIAGCSTTRSTVETPNTPSLSIEEIFSQLHTAADIPESEVQIDASFSVKAPVFTGNLSAAISHRKGDSLYARLSATMLRVDAGRLLVTPDSFFFYHRIEKQVLYGPNDAVNQLLPGLLDGDQVFERLLGTLTPDPASSWSVEQIGDNIYLHRSDQMLRYIINAETWRVAVREEYLEDGTLIETLRFDDYKTSGVHSLPHRISLQRRDVDASVSATYNSVILNPGAMEFEFEVPPDVPWISVEASN